MLGDQTCNVPSDCNSALCKGGFYICFGGTYTSVHSPNLITCNADDDCVKNCPLGSRWDSAKCRDHKCSFVCN